MEGELTRFFNTLLTEPIPSCMTTIYQVTKHILSLLTNENNASLMQPITMNEFEAVVNHMVEEKALGHNGFTIKIFHHYQDLLKDEVHELVEES